MGPLGLPELLMIFVVALVVFGPRRLPEIGRTLGKALNEFKKATEDLKNTIEREVRVDELRQIAPTIVEPPAQTVSRGEPLPAETVAEVTPAAEPLPPADGGTPITPATPKAD